MPDCDILHRGVPKGWGRATNLACGGAPFDAIVDAVAGAAVRVLTRDDVEPLIGTIGAIVRDELGQRMRVSTGAREDAIARVVAGASAAGGDSSIGRLAGTAAARGVCGLTAPTATLEPGLVERSIVRRLVETIVDALWLSRVRGRVAEAAGRSLEGQLKWGAALLDQAGRRGAEMLGHAAKDETEQHSAARDQSDRAAHRATPNALPHMGPEVRCTLNRRPTCRTVSFPSPTRPTHSSEPDAPRRANRRFAIANRLSFATVL